MELYKQFLDYMAMQEDAILTYHASNMVLAIYCNASYLSKPKSCSCVGRYMPMAGKDGIPFNNGAILNIQLRWSCRGRALAVAGRSLNMVKPNPIHGHLLILVYRSRKGMR
jgi:hypothetical protein